VRKLIVAYLVLSVCNLHKMPLIGALPLRSLQRSQYWKRAP